MADLRLMAVDEDDLAILSAHCQDAVTRVADLRWLPRERRFVMAMNRFAWERAEAPRGLLARLRPAEYERRRAALAFNRVTAVRRLGPAFSDPDAVLSLLAVRFEAGERPSGTVELVFAAGAAVRLDVEVIEAQLADLGAAWSTAARPDHDRSDRAS